MPPYTRAPSELAIVAIIPARFASTRLPGKPLSDIHGRTMIQRVYERARARRKVDRVLVATDDERIAAAVRAFGGEVRADLARTTERHRPDRRGRRRAWTPRSWSTSRATSRCSIRRASTPRSRRCSTTGPCRSRRSRCRCARAEEMLAPVVVKVVSDAPATRSISPARPIPHVRLGPAADCARLRRRPPWRAASRASTSASTPTAARRCCASRRCPRRPSSRRRPRAAARAAPRHADPRRPVEGDGGRGRRHPRGPGARARAARPREGKESVDQVHLRDRRRRLLPRQGARLRLDRRPARGPRLQGRA